jgi:SOS-response transcriptional repressor LexA
MRNLKNNTENEAERLKEVLLRSGMSARQFSEKLEISEAQMSNILKGKRRPSREVLDKLVDYFDVDLNWLLCGETEDVVYIDFINQEAAAGHGMEIDEYAEKKTIAVPRSFIGTHKPKNIRAITVRGDSMIDAQIFDGDYVLFDTRDKLGENIFVVSVGTTLLVKRVIVDDFKKTITLLSANAVVNYPPRIFIGDERDEVRIEGKVIAWWHRV